jgi:WD40 repeat protein
LNHRATIPAQAPGAGVIRQGDLFAGLAVSPDGKKLGVSERGARGFTVIDIATRKSLWHIHSWASHAEFSKDGRFVAIEGNLCGFQYREAATGKLLAHYGADHSNPVRSFRLSPDGKTVAWMVNPHPAGSAIELHQIADWKLEGSLASELETQVASFSPSGQQILLLSRGMTAVDSVTTGHYISTGYGVTLSCYSLGGHLLWQRDGQASQTINLSGEDFCDAAFSPDGRTVALRDAGDQNGLLLLDANDGHELRRLSGGRGIEQIRDSGVAFSADGKRVFGRGQDTVLVWDLTR